MKRTKVVLFVLGGGGGDDTKVYVYDIIALLYDWRTHTKAERRKRRPGACLN